MARIARAHAADPRVARLQMQVETWRAQVTKLASSSTAFHEWRRVQFEARRAYYIAQRECIDLHTTFARRVENDSPYQKHVEAMASVHQLLREFAIVLSALDKPAAR